MSSTMTFNMLWALKYEMNSRFEVSISMSFPWKIQRAGEHALHIGAPDFIAGTAGSPV